MLSLKISLSVGLAPKQRKIGEKGWKKVKVLLNPLNTRIATKF